MVEGWVEVDGPGWAGGSGRMFLLSMLVRNGCHGPDLVLTGGGGGDKFGAGFNGVSGGEGKAKFAGRVLWSKSGAGT